MSTFKKTFSFEIEKVDLNGDGKFETIYITGTRDYHDRFYIRDITLVIEVEVLPRPIIIKLPIVAGYNPRIFPGIFNKGNVINILVIVDSAPSGGFSYYYIYSFVNNKVILLFQKEIFNNEFRYAVDFRDNFYVTVHNHHLKKVHRFDIIENGKYIHAEIYNKSGRLLRPTSGFLHGVYYLHPLITAQEGVYNLLAIHRVHGLHDRDVLGHLESALEWDGTRFVPVTEQVRL